jgi:cysteine desulfurase / selenocysteine lyase
LRDAPGVGPSGSGPRDVIPSDSEGSALPFDVDALRAREFPWTDTDGVVYLNAASTGPQPQRTIEKLKEWAELRGSMHKIDYEMQFGTLRRSRELCAKLIGAEAAEIALATNTGFGINLAARALPLNKGDILLVPDGEFPANVYPWMGAAHDRGLEVRQLSMRDGLLDEDALIRALDDRAVKVVGVSWVGFATGYRADLERIGQACRQRDIYFVVDAIQGLGPFTLDVRACHIDVLACGGQKWLLAPWGSAFAYIRRELIGRLEPPFVGWMAPKNTDDFNRMLDYDITWRDDARRFELISLPYQDFAGLNASLELLEELGHRAVGAHVTALADKIVSCAQSWGIDLLTPADRERRAGIVSIRPRDAAAASQRLTSAGIVHSLREGAIRLSPHVYNTAAEIRQVFELL